MDKSYKNDIIRTVERCDKFEKVKGFLETFGKYYNYDVFAAFFVLSYQSFEVNNFSGGSL